MNIYWQRLRMKKLLSLLSASLFFFSLYVNFLAGSGRLNDIGTGEISGLYPTLFTPAGITFSIWGVIFLLNSVFVLSQVYLAFKTPQSFSIALNSFYIGLSLTNISWLLLWHHQQIGLSLIVIVLYLLSTLKLYTLSSALNTNNTPIYRFAYINFSVYAGWLSVATIANTAVCLTTIGLEPYGNLAMILTITVLVVALLLAYFFLTNQRNFWYPLVISWALFGIYLASSQGTTEDTQVIKVVSIVFLSGLIIYYLYSLLQLMRTKKVG